VGGVELTGSVSGNRDPQVTRQREEGQLVIVWIEAGDNHRIGERPALVAGPTNTDQQDVDPSVTLARQGIRVERLADKLEDG
jgi:hypothetical protein